MDKDFRLTSSEYAKMLGITTEGLRSRRRRGLEDGNFKQIEKVFWWKSPGKDRPIAVEKSKMNGGPRSVKPGSRKRRRGVMLEGKETNYHNARNGWQLEELNRVRALGKIRDKLGDEVVDEISPELFELAKKRVQEKKQKKLEKENLKAQEQLPEGHISGLDLTPTIYGTKLNAEGLKRVEGYTHKNSLKRWLEETKVNFRTEPGKRHLPNFEDSQNSFRAFRNPYEPGGGTIDDGSVEIDYNSIRPRYETNGMYSDEPKFKNKIQEEIFRLNLKKNK